MKIIVRATADAVAEVVHDLIVERLMSKPTTVFGLPTGGTPVPVYKKLVESQRAGRTSWKSATTFNLDEYLGLGPEHAASYAAFMRHNLFDHVDCPAYHRHIPNGLAHDVVAEAAAYESAIAAAGGMDFLLLGLGHNGHIGFNEPGSEFTSRTRRVALTPSTLAANSQFFAPGEAPPVEAISMGIGTILEARTIVVAVTGSAKADAVARCLKGPQTIDTPGSALQSGNDVTFVIDESAAAHIGRSRQDRRPMA